MVETGVIEHAGIWSKQALESLAQHGLSPTPRNYAVYYHFFSEKIPALNAVFDAQLSRGKMTQEVCDELYDKFLMSKSEMSFIGNANKIIDGELKKVMSLLEDSAKGADQFGENLGQFSGKLASATSAELLREAVEKIADETRVIAAQNQNLQNELTATTHQLSEMREDFNRIHKEAQIDPLTGVGNRKYFDNEIARALGEARNANAVLTLLMIDIDHFKKFNDAHGHLIGDQVLRLVAHTLVENLKGRDIIARYGGEEFVILLPQTRLSDAERVANFLRTTLATKQIRKRGSQEILGVITISVGAAEYMLGEDRDALIARADRSLYKAKQTGRNKVVCAGVDEGQR